jgi:hypothetical protein
MLKLALAGIAVVGFFLSSISERLQRELFTDPIFLTLLFVALIGFAFSVAFALLYRYNAGGAQFHHVDYLKIVTLNCRNEFVENKSRTARKSREKKFFKLDFYTKFSATMLFFAACLLGSAFIKFMWIARTAACR